MDQVLVGLLFPWCYVDDVIIFSNTPQKHVMHLQSIFEWLSRWGLRLHHRKCKGFHYHLLYLVHVIVPIGLKVQQAKVDVLQKIPTPNDIPRLCAFLGFANYFCQTIKDFNFDCQTTNYTLQAKDQVWTWSPEQCHSFETLRQRLGMSYYFDIPTLQKFFNFMQIGIHWVWEWSWI